MGSVLIDLWHVRLTIIQVWHTINAAGQQWMYMIFSIVEHGLFPKHHEIHKLDSSRAVLACMDVADQWSGRKKGTWHVAIETEL